MVSTSPPPPNAVNDEPPAYDTDAASQLDELSMSLVAQPSSCELLVSLVPPTQPQPLGEKLTGRRAPLDLCLVIDVSGSMNTEAPVPGEQDKNETTGLSVLDVVKHATRTIIESMDDGDRIAIVTFSDSAEVITHLTPTTKENRARVWNQVNGLRTKGMTNLWDGLKAGMNVIMGASRASEGSSSPKTPKGSTPLASPTTSTFSKRTSFLSSIGLGKKKRAPALPPPDKAPPSSDCKPPVSPSTADHQSHDSRQRLSAVLILTDGQPNVEPPRGHIPMLKSYLDALPADSPKFTISTFGFGYSLDSRLLDEIADLGQGTYGFIPDSGMVGTVFVHAVANLMTTWATACILDVEVVMEDPSAEAKVNVLGSLPVTSSSWGASIQVGDIQYGQSREVVVQLPVECFGPNAKHVTNITARYLPHTRATHGSPLHIKQTLGPSYEVDSSVMLQHEVYRLSFIRAVSELFQKTDRGSNSPPSGTQFEQALVAHTSNPLLKDHGPSTALTSDITSQVVLGLQSEHWSRWGMHYIPSLARSHQRQQCSNFKDPGLQMYGRDSSLFTSTRDAIDQTFDSLPPPTPSLKDRNVYRPGKSAPATYAPLSSMSKYRSSSAPCFAGWCLVDTGDGRPTKVSDLHRGSVIRASSGMARVAAVLRTVCPMGVTDLCLIGRLAVTPWHPVKFGDSWVFPAKVCEPEPVACDYVYSILLEPSTDPEMHALNVEGVWCVTLGHGCTDPVRAHPFLGDYARVVESLSRMEGYHSTRGVVDGTGVVRDEETGLVCGFKKLGINEDSSAMVPGVPLQYIACEA